MVLWRPSSNAVRFAYSAVSNDDDEEIQQKANENFGRGPTSTVYIICIFSTSTVCIICIFSTCTVYIICIFSTCTVHIICILSISTVYIICIFSTSTVHTTYTHTYLVSKYLD